MRRAGSATTRRYFRRLHLGTALLLLAGVGCEHNSIAPDVAVIEVATATAGGDLDPDGYDITVDSGLPRRIDSNGTIVFDSLSPGTHRLALSGVATNCTLQSTNPVSVTVPGGTRAEVHFTVSCQDTTGTLIVHTETTGSSLDPDGFGVRLDSLPAAPVGTADSLVLGRLLPGSHRLELDGVAANCAVGGGNPRTVRISAGQTAGATFSVTCQDTTGSLKIATTTSGSSLDPDGYQVSLDGGAAQPIALTGILTLDSVVAGSHVVQLSDVAGNCAVSGSPQRTVPVAVDSATQVRFDVSCHDTTGTLEVRTATTGSSLDPDGYLVSVDGAAGLAMALRDTIQFDSLVEGDHTVRLSGVAANCTVSGANPRRVTVQGEQTVRTTFQVACQDTTGAIEITTSTGGSNLDPDGYTLALDGGPPQPMGLNATLTLLDLLPGSHQVDLGDVAANCSVGGSNPRSLMVTAGATARTTFQVSCAPPSGTLQVTASTSGRNADPDGYSVAIDGGSGHTLASNGTLSLTLAAGSHDVRVGGLSNNCTLGVANPQTVSVPVGGTVQLAVPVACSAVINNQILFLRLVSGRTKYFLINPDGSGLLQISSGAGNDQDASVSPDGRKILFSSDRGGDFEVYLMDADGGNLTNLTTNPAKDTDPAWSPDGSLIIFESNRSGNEDVWRMNPDGSGLVNLTNAPGDDGDVTWSPDGSQIAFESHRDGNAEIYVMNADGSNQTNLTRNPKDDADPAWSPDGTRIAFGSHRNGPAPEIYTMNPDGSNPKRLTNNPAYDAAPAWSPDGRQIAFHSDRTGNFEVFIMNPDGTHQVNLTQSPSTWDTYPEWGSLAP